MLLSKVLNASMAAGFSSTGKTLDDIKKQCCVYEVKRQAKKFSPADLEQKAAAFARNIPGYRLTLTGLSMDDM